MKLPLFATVGLHSSLEEVELNFGARPFAFDVRALAAEEAAAEVGIAGEQGERMSWMLPSS